MLTTFDLSAAFLEDHTPPAVLRVEAKTTSVRNTTVHHRLALFSRIRCLHPGSRDAIVA